MKKSLVACFIILIANTIFGQSDTTQAYPVEGLKSLSLKALGIEFPPPLKSKLHGATLGFIFDVDEEGVGILEEVNGVKDIAIIDSFKRVYAPHVAFKPLLINGQANASFFFFKVNYPIYQKGPSENAFYVDRFSFQLLKISDFEKIEYSRHREEVSVGGIILAPISGQAQNYLGVGGGMDIDVLYMFPEWMVGINMQVNGVKRRGTWPDLVSTLPLANYPSSLHGNFSFGYHEDQWSIQAEAGGSLLNMVYNSGENTMDGIQTRGWNTGLSYKYRIPIGAEKPTNVYGTPYVLRFDLQLLMRTRIVNFDYKPANGVMLEAGAAFGMHYKRIKSFKLKNQIN